LVALCEYLALFRTSTRSRSNVRVSARCRREIDDGPTWYLLCSPFLVFPLRFPDSHRLLGLYRIAHGFHDMPCLFCSLSVALIATTQGRWRVATRAFNRDKRSCHEAGSGITIRELESVYRCIEANTPGVVALHSSLIFPSFSYFFLLSLVFSRGMWVGWLSNISFNLVFESRIYPLGASVSICESLFTLHAEYVHSC